MCFKAAKKCSLWDWTAATYLFAVTDSFWHIKMKACTAFPCFSSLHSPTGHELNPAPRASSSICKSAIRAKDEDLPLFAVCVSANISVGARVDK